MHRWAALATLVASGSMATSAAAADDEGPAAAGVRLGVRSGFAVPAGNAFDGSGALADTITGYVPVRVDVGVRFARRFYAGALVQLGAVVPAACPRDMQCSGSNTRLGIMVGLHLLPSGWVDPWVGVGAGYEILSVTRSTGASRLDLTARGIELLDLEVGIDLRPTAGFRIGPVISASVGQYTSVVLNGTATSDFTRALHTWGMLGIRVAYDL